MNELTACVVNADTERIHCSGAPEEEQYHLKQERYQRPEQGEDHRPNCPATDMGQLYNHVGHQGEHHWPHCPTIEMGQFKKYVHLTQTYNEHAISMVQL